ncbi:hypothetical protein QJS66_20560 [Kocuria rhizophila]|nr:hypothetical protein QJS66_20560 [Kocuria rhizophila]
MTADVQEKEIRPTSRLLVGSEEAAVGSPPRTRRAEFPVRTLRSSPVRPPRASRSGQPQLHEVPRARFALVPAPPRRIWLRLSGQRQAAGFQPAGGAAAQKISE